MGVLIWLVTFLIVVSSAAAAVCDRCVHRSTATYYKDSTKAFWGEGCGYNGTNFNVIHFAGAPKSIFDNGIGCGRCYQVRCTNGAICSDGGVNVTVTSVIERKQYTAFVLSEAAFTAMAKDKAGRTKLVGLGNVQVQYKRVPCNYENKNMMIWVEVSSKKDKNYLAIKFLYKEGQTDIVAVNVANKNTKWVSMSRSDFGVIWYKTTAPSGALRFQFNVTSETTKYVFPAYWKNGMTYDSGLQITDVAKDEKCKKCDYTVWG